MSLLADIFQSTKDYLNTNLVAAKLVTLGFVDERADNSSEDSYPMATITLYDVATDNTRRHGGFVRERIDSGGNTIQLKRLPIPINYHFQLDVIGNKLRPFWDLNQEIQIILGRRYTKLTMVGGKVFYLILETINHLMDIEGPDIHRTSYRYYVQVWLIDPETPTVVNKVLKLKIQYKVDIPDNIVEVP